ncbi:MAG TPA: hypothetical protein VGI39_39025 [Polyangiaceae bacterium]|jgi:hypothetical protein
MRQCTACGLEKPETTEFFYAHSGCRGGLHTQCKKCQKQRNVRAARRRRPEFLSEKACTKCKKVYPCTKEHFYPLKTGRGGFGAHCKGCVGAYQQRRYEANKEQMLAASRARHAKRGGVWRENQRTKHWLSSLLAITKASARRRGLDFALDEETVRAIWERQQGRCYWFGIPIVPSGVHRDPQRPSIDRLENDKGYTPDNVVLCCMAANLGRSETTAERFRAFVTLLQASKSEADDDAEPLFERLSALTERASTPTVQ